MTEAAGAGPSTRPTPPDGRSESVPEWARWHGRPVPEAYTVGIEEEVMLLDPGTWALAFAADSVLPTLPGELAKQTTSEMHGAALELSTEVHTGVPGATAELRDLRRSLERHLESVGYRAASAGTHPFALWSETVLSSGRRYQQLYGSIRELARREPTFGLHVHVGVPDPDDGLRLFDRLRGHLPLFLALSANSPFWQGRDTGLASARTPLFQAFPRSGIPRRLGSYAEWVRAVGLLIRHGAIEEPTFLWWDVRPQPRLGTVEVRIMDAQTTVDATAALAALVQSTARLELREGWAGPVLLGTPEVLDENRFLAARDGIRAELLDPDADRRVAAADQLRRLVDSCRAHAQDLGCEAELEHALAIAASPELSRQRDVARRGERLPGLVASLAERFSG